MTDPFDYERRFERRLTAHAARASRPFDAAAIASQAVASSARRSSPPLLARLVTGRDGRVSTMRVALLGLLLLAAVGACTVLIGSLLRSTTPIPERLVETVPSASASASTSASASASASAAATTAGASLRARWIANDPGSDTLGTSSGPIDLTIDGSGHSVAVGNLGSAGDFGSSIVSATADQLVVRLDHATRGCAEGAEGTYAWVLGSDGSQLTLTAVTDACSDRTIAFGRAWARTLIGSSSTGTGIVDSISPGFFIALPGGPYTSRTLPDYVDVGDPNGLDFQVWKDPQGFADPCSLANRAPYVPGSAAVVNYLRHNPAINVIEQTSLKIDGHPAIHIVVEGKTVAKCPGQDLQLWTPKSCDCHWVTADGVRDSFYLVDVGADTYAFELNPVDASTDESPITQTLRIPAALPGS
jgi:hypothetical protein